MSDAELTVGRRALMLVWTNPAHDSSLAEFNGWYDNRMREMRDAIPSIIEITRFSTSPLCLGADPTQTQHRYLAVYELDRDDVDAVERRIK